MTIKRRKSSEDYIATLKAKNVDFLTHNEIQVLLLWEGVDYSPEGRARTLAANTIDVLATEVKDPLALKAGVD